MTDKPNNPPGGNEQQPPSRRVTSSDEAAEVPFSPGVLFGMLSDTRQRYILYYLQEYDGVGTLKDMSDQLAAWENETTVELSTEEVQNRVYSGLYHADLPKLDDYGFVSYDRETGKVKATDQLDAIGPYIDFAKEIEPDDYERFLELLETEESREDYQR